mgnify:CR=1 FL=1
MIRRIKVLASAIQDDLVEEPPATDTDCASSEDAGLEVLVRNAIRQEVAQHDGGRVWQVLSRRVRGPFGALAVEEPAMCGAYMPIFTETSADSGRQPDAMRHSLFRTAEATFSMR